MADDDSFSASPRCYSCGRRPGAQYRLRVHIVDVGQETSNRGPDEWLATFAGPVRAQRCMLHHRGAVAPAGAASLRAGSLGTDPARCGLPLAEPIAPSIEAIHYGFGSGLEPVRTKIRVVDYSSAPGQRLELEGTIRDRRPARTQADREEHGAT